MGNTNALDAMAEPRRSILLAIKRGGSSGIADLAALIGITYEGIRQHLGQLELDGWVVRRLIRDGSGPGRPKTKFQLTTAGEHLFPKEYDDLVVALIDAAADRLGPEAVQTLLEEVARKKVEAWEPQLAGKSFEERLEALKGIYQEGDPFCEVGVDEEGNPRLVEMNCPFLEVARKRPALCSVTVSVLRRLLGRKVVRSERFQNGEGRCVFKVLEEEVVPADSFFAFEPVTGVQARSDV